MHQIPKLSREYRARIETRYHGQLDSSFPHPSFHPCVGPHPRLSKALPSLVAPSPISIDATAPRTPLVDSIFICFLLVFFLLKFSSSIFYLFTEFGLWILQSEGGDPKTPQQTKEKLRTSADLGDRTNGRQRLRQPRPRLRLPTTGQVRPHGQAIILVILLQTLLEFHPSTQPYIRRPTSAISPVHGFRLRFRLPCFQERPCQVVVGGLAGVR